MSSSFDFQNPYWGKVSEAEEAYLDENKPLARTDGARWALYERTMNRIDLAIFFLDRMDLEQYRFKSGRLNRRKLAKVLVEQIAKRNRERRNAGRATVQEVGIRSMELTLASIISEK